KSCRPLGGNLAQVPAAEQTAFAEVVHLVAGKAAKSEKQPFSHRCGGRIFWLAAGFRFILTLWFLRRFLNPLIGDQVSRNRFRLFLRKTISRHAALDRSLLLSLVAQPLPQPIAVNIAAEMEERWRGQRLRVSFLAVAG